MDGRRQTATLEISEVNEPNSDPSSPLPVPKSPAPLGPSAPQREQIIDRLTRSFAEDALTMDEFERRAELVYGAASMTELQALVADLPAPVESGAVTTGGKQTGSMVTGDRISTLLGSTERRMPAHIPRHLTIRTMLGNTELDFRNSKFEPGITEVHVKCFMGNVEISVPDGVRVELLCSSVLANVGTDGSDAIDDSVENLLENPIGTAVATPASATSVLRVTGRAILANVEVHKR